MLHSIAKHIPALTVAIPLLTAFSVPVVGRFNVKLRNILVVLGTVLTSAAGLFLA